MSMFCEILLPCVPADIADLDETHLMWAGTDQKREPAYLWFEQIRFRVYAIPAYIHNALPEGLRQRLTTAVGVNQPSVETLRNAIEARPDCDLATRLRSGVARLLASANEWAIYIDLGVDSAIEVITLERRLIPEVVVSFLGHPGRSGARLLMSE
jgi:hypothetical protein